MSFQNSRKLFFWEVTPLPHDGLEAGEALVPLNYEKVDGTGLTSIIRYAITQRGKLFAPLICIDY